jgi:hypothetical protein
MPLGGASIFTFSQGLINGYYEFIPKEYALKKPILKKRTQF